MIYTSLEIMSVSSIVNLNYKHISSSNSLVKKSFARDQISTKLNFLPVGGHAKLSKISQIGPNLQTGKKNTEFL